MNKVRSSIVSALSERAVGIGPHAHHVTHMVLTNIIAAPLTTHTGAMGPLWPD
jgi:hypothetical protein